MKIDFWFGIILVVLFFLILPSIFLVVFYDRERQNKILKIFGIISFLVYCILLSLLVFGKINFDGNSFTITLEKTGEWFKLNFVVASFEWLNIFLNLVMIFPIGAFVFSQSKSNVLIKTILMSFLISFCIETLQFILPINRTTEILDIILNTISGIIGYIYYYLLLKVFKKI